MFRVSSFKPKDAQAALSVVFLIGGIIVLTAMTITFLSASFLGSSYGFQMAQQAQAVAASGVFDAMMRLDRNKDLSTSYSLPLNNYSASVTITQDSPAAGLVKIVSASTVVNRNYKIQAVVSRNASNGLIGIVSWGQLL